MVSFDLRWTKPHLRPKLSMKAGLKKSAKKSLIPVDYQVISQVFLLEISYIQSKQRAAFPARNHRPFYIITYTKMGKMTQIPKGDSTP